MTDSFFFFLEYHNSLVEHGVTEYDWLVFSKDCVMAIVEECIKRFIQCNEFKPKTFRTFAKKIYEEKAAENFIKLGEELLAKPLLCLTSLYVKDKDNFLI